MSAAGIASAVGLADVEALARGAVEPSAFDYCSGGAEDELALEDNVAAFRRRRLWPKVLAGTGRVDLTVSVLGRELPFPVLLAPVGLQELFHRSGEEASARAAAGLGTVFCVSMFTSRPIERLTAAGAGPRWAQVYLVDDRGVVASTIARAAAAGAEAIVVTVDYPVVGKRERGLRGGYERFDACRPALLDDPAFGELLTARTTPDDPLALLAALFPNPRASWADLDRVRSLTDLPLVVKGVLRPSDAVRAVEAGADAVVVSNHGGRQLDRAPASVDALSPVVEAVDGRAEVLLDSGVRRGADVAVALALGARAVLVGRPMLWGLAAGGEAGVRRSLEILRDELATTLALVGCGAARELDRSFLWRPGGVEDAAVAELR